MSKMPRIKMIENNPERKKYRIVMVVFREVEMRRMVEKLVSSKAVRKGKRLEEKISKRRPKMLVRMKRGESEGTDKLEMIQGSVARVRKRQATRQRKGSKWKRSSKRKRLVV